MIGVDDDLSTRLKEDLALLMHMMEALRRKKNSLYRSHSQGCAVVLFPFSIFPRKNVLHISLTIFISLSFCLTSILYAEKPPPF